MSIARSAGRHRSRTSSPSSKGRTARTISYSATCPRQATARLRRRSAARDLGSGVVATRAGGAGQDITANQRALALRVGLFDRCFVNSEASPDGHNWATAACSTDDVDKSFRWSYSGRGRTYDFEGFNRLPDLDAKKAPDGLRLPATAAGLSVFWFVPRTGARCAVRLYLTRRAGLSYRNTGSSSRRPPMTCGGQCTNGRAIPTSRDCLAVLLLAPRATSTPIAPSIPTPDAITTPGCIRRPKHARPRRRDRTAACRRVSAACRASVWP